jgi:hypothetical protein
VAVSKIKDLNDACINNTAVQKKVNNSIRAVSYNTRYFTGDFRWDLHVALKQSHFV